MLQGTRIIELSEGVAGPLAALRLADLGADVIKVERAEGDWMRDAEPLMANGMSAAFFALNRGKRCLALGSDPSAASELLLRLLADADAFIVDGGEAQAESLGFAEALRPNWGRNPGLVVVDVSIWGENGPMAALPGSELTVQAMAGYTRYLGSADEAPKRLGADVAGASASAFAVQAALAALYARDRRNGSRAGQQVSVSMLNALISMKSIHLAAQSDPDQYAGPRVGGAHYPPEKGWRTADRPIFFAFGGSVGEEGRPGWTDFVTEIGLDDLLKNDQLDRNGRNSTGHGSMVNAMRPAYEERFAQFSAADLVGRIRKLGANAAVYMRADETLADPQTVAMDLISEDPESRRQVLKFPARFANVQLQQRFDAPELGKDSEMIARELGFSRAEFAELQARGALAM
ncbi:CoA transferase [Bradyrhizobium sp. LHD-71]|uniref:CoA transferase n=1 Tax=Bradyrhizobium sp. LHD-71 TaxID=3072141 RepID=UPI00280F82FD|nr:CoA transferase [Bradyrhizobium sp. LHD-71]MDQ8731452.1 CoA transferase [Bradyrhizobium sp. LHD-71]